MDARTFKPKRRHILVEAAQSMSPSGLLFLPDSVSEPYPQSGWVISKGDNTDPSISIDDLVVFPILAQDIPQTTFDLLHIELENDTLILLPQYEDSMKEIIEKARRTGEHVVVTVQNFDNNIVKFYTKDVRSYQRVQHSYDRISSRYPTDIHVFWLGEKLYYVMKDSIPLFVLENYD